MPAGSKAKVSLKSGVTAAISLPMGSASSALNMGQLSGGIIAVFAPAAVVDLLQDSAHRVVLCFLADMFAKGAFGFAV